MVGAETLLPQDSGLAGPLYLCIIWRWGRERQYWDLSGEEGIIATYLGSDGGGAHLLELPAGCSLMPASLGYH